MQTRSVLFRPRPRLFALCALGALLLLGAGAIFTLTAAKKSSPVLARTEEWEVRRGAPDAAGKRTLLRGKGLGLEDYLSLLHREGKITLLHGGAPWAAVYCFPADGTLTVSVPAEGSVSAGLDNTGWAVAAVSFGYIP